MILAVFGGRSLAQTATEQTGKKSTPSPDFPGAILFEWGMDYINSNSESMNTKAWQSPTFNIYYTYPLKFGGSRFAFVPGAGLSMQRLSFSNPVTLLDSSRITLLKGITDLPRFQNTENITRSKLFINYLDFPAEFRIHSRKNDHKRSWYLAFGAKFGLRIKAKTKIKFTEFGSDKVEQDSYNFHLNAIQVGYYGRFGYGPFTFWYFHRSNTLFQGDKIQGFLNPRLNTFGISFSTF